VKGLPFTALDSSQTHVDSCGASATSLLRGCLEIDLLRAAAPRRADPGGDRDVDALDPDARACAAEQFPRLKIFARARTVNMPLRSWTGACGM